MGAVDLSKWSKEPEFLNPNSESWTEGKGPAWLSELKAHVRNHFFNVEKNELCCYCQRPPRSKHGYENDVEHIAPRDRYVRYTFEPNNLAVVCKHCNGHKSNKEVFKQLRTVKCYPKNGKPFSIYHPHFHVYDEHIQKIHPGIYVPRTPEGTNTISICGLDILNNKIFSALSRDGVYEEIEFQAVELCENYIDAHRANNEAMKRNALTSIGFFINNVAGSMWAKVRKKRSEVAP